MDRAVAPTQPFEHPAQALSGRLAGTCLVAAAVALTVLFFSTGSVYVNGVRVPIGRQWSVADCARLAGVRIETGDLKDVAGEVLSAGRGLPARAWRNDEQASLSSLVRRHDKLHIMPARDVTETIDDEVKYLLATCKLPGGTRPVDAAGAAPIRSIQRVRRGRISRKIYRSERADATAIVYAANTPSRPKCLALTFDDGPCREWTPKILDALRKHGARATFFVMGHAVQYSPEIARRTVAEGHELGNHSWLHADYTKLSVAAARKDLRRTSDAINGAGQERVRWFRPPYGEHNARVRDVVAEAGMKIALWDVDTRDWQRPGAEAIYRRIMKGARDGRVILLHDGPAKRRQTLAALNLAVPKLKEQGYQLVTMSEAKGLVPVFGGQVVLRIAEEEYRFDPLPGDTVVEVAGKPLAMPLAPLRSGAELLVPARQIAEPLGAVVTYDKPGETLTIQKGARSAVFRLDSLFAEINDEEVELAVPPVLYQGRALVPLSYLKSILAVGCVYDAVRHVLRIAPLESAATEAPRPGRSPSGPTARSPHAGFASLIG